jgi:hypothetical protein
MLAGAEFAHLCRACTLPEAVLLLAFTSCWAAARSAGVRLEPSRCGQAGEAQGASLAAFNKSQIYNSDWVSRIQTHFLLFSSQTANQFFLFICSTVLRPRKRCLEHKTDPFNSSLSDEHSDHNHDKLKTQALASTVSWVIR